ncbi:DUF4328 domain-containing protein [Plantactinospora sp. GCM10030261]|uniref:DUF4328 domain-containing protein n=1 Tax=Plantactinospora sp. GCM10030261 TaxID=3273420 RepID=UPI0036220730
MRCQICKRDVPPQDVRCRFCHAPLWEDPGVGQQPAYGVRQAYPTQPPASPAFPAQPTATRTYAVRGVGIAAIVAVAATALVDTLLSFWPIIGRRMAVRAQQTDDPELLSDAALLEAVLTLPVLACTLAAATLVIIWFYRARKNIEAFPEATPGMGAGWAIGGWFIPFANLVIPCRVMIQIARGSLGRAGAPALIGVWWAGWVINSYGGQLLSRLDQRRYDELPTVLATPDDYQAYVDYYGSTTITYPLVALCGVVAAGALAVLIIRISAAQTARIRGGGQPIGQVLPGMAMPSPAGPEIRGGTIGA